VVAGGSSPDKFLFLAEDESVLQQIVSSPSTPDHMFVEDCSDEDDYDEDEVDYSTSGGSSKFFRSPVPPSTGSNSAGTPHSASKASSLCDPGQSSRPVASPVTKGPSPVPAPQLNTPDLAVAEHNPPAVASSPAEAPNSGTSLSPAPAPAEKWRDLFASNRSTITGPKLPFSSSSCDDLPCDLSPDDLDNNYDLWQLCIVGYVAGKSPGFKALNNIISYSWKCEASLAIHESGWLVYKFKTVDDKLANGSYLIYGRPLILKAMPEYFDFGTDEMSCVPIWIKFPSLPLKCWSPKCLSKIASKLGTPIQSDLLTFNMSRISYARVLVELNLLADLKSSIVINLLNGSTLNQPVIYETLPRFCKLCKVLGHNTGSCSSSPPPAVASPLEQDIHQPTATAKSRNVFARLGPAAETITELPNFCNHRKTQGHTTGTCSKSKEEARPVEKADATELATKGNVKGKRSVFTRLSPAIDTLVDAPSAVASTVEASPVVTPQVDASELDASTVPPEACVAQEVQLCSQATAASPEGWQTVSKRRHNSGSKRQKQTPLPVESKSPSSKGKSPASSVNVAGNKASHRTGSSMLSRSLVQRNSTRSSGSGGVPPTLPHP